MLSLPRAFVFGALAAALGCQDRVASQEIDFETLKIESCESVCVTIEACNPEILDWDPEGIWPHDCFERCMTSFPLLHEENQCGSHTMRWMRCVGGLDCDGYTAFHEGNNQLSEGQPPDYSAPCVWEFQDFCFVDQPFNLDDIPPLP